MMSCQAFSLLARLDELGGPFEKDDIKCVSSGGGNGTRQGTTWEPTGHLSIVLKTGSFSDNSFLLVVSAHIISMYEQSTTPRHQYRYPILVSVLVQPPQRSKLND